MQHFADPHSVIYAIFEGPFGKKTNPLENFQHFGIFCEHGTISKSLKCAEIVITKRHMDEQKSPQILFFSREFLKDTNIQPCSKKNLWA